MTFFSVAAKLRQGRARQLCSQVKGKAFLKALISSVLASKKTHSKLRIYDWKISSFYRQALCFNNSTLVHWVLDLQKYHFYLKIASLYMLSPFFQRLQFAKKNKTKQQKPNIRYGVLFFSHFSELKLQSTHQQQKTRELWSTYTFLFPLQFSVSGSSLSSTDEMTHIKFYINFYYTPRWDSLVERLSAQSFYWDLVTRHPLLGMYQYSRTPEGNRFSA